MPKKQKSLWGWLKANVKLGNTELVCTLVPGSFLETMYDKNRMVSFYETISCFKY